MTNQSKLKVIAIVGPTASGKTALAIDLAKLLDGEVISADSRQVYRGMDIGTGKVTVAEMQGIPHHLIDIVDPTQIYTGIDFKRDGEMALAEIVKRGTLPIIAGGTFFYLELLRGTMAAAPVPPNPELRAILETKTTAELQSELARRDITHSATAIDHTNRRRLIRAIEIITVLGLVPKPDYIVSPYNWFTLGIDVPTDILNERIHRRIIERLDQGMIAEIKKLHDSGVTWERLESFGLEYRYIARYLQNQLTKEAMLDELTAKTRQFAKRQRTWLKRDVTIHWFPFPVTTSLVEDSITTFLAHRS